jgi:uncharacterized membrane protein
MLGSETSQNARISQRWLVALFVLVCIVFAKVIPPMQSPDEFDHVKRAYLLSKGVLVLEPSASHGSGGHVDTGLLSYFGAYGMLPYQPARKLSQEEMYTADGVKWSGKTEFSAAPGTGYYLPLIYVPQALGLTIGEMANLTVADSYDLARVLNIVCSALLLLAAFRLYPTNPWVLAVLVLPMSLFQFASATIDGLSLSLTIFAVSAFLRIARERTQTPAWLLCVLALSLVALISSRVHMLPMVALLLAAGFYSRQRVAFVLFAMSLAIIGAWLYLAMSTTLDKRVAIGAGAGEVIGFYLQHPIQFLRVLHATLVDRDLIRFYWHSFVGVLGWLDTSFTIQTYGLYGALIIGIGMLSISWKNLRTEWLARALLLACAASAVLLTFIALLVTWNKHPAHQVLGVQGRYFALPMVLIAYALAAGKDTFQGFARKVAAAGLLLLAYISITSTLSLLLNRYYQTFNPIEPVTAALRATPPLGPESPIAIEMSQRHLNDPRELVGLGIDFGTYARTNQGIGELQLQSVTGQVIRQSFDLGTLQDNQYAEIYFPPGLYTKGTIVSLAGGGVSVWEAQMSNGYLNTCLIYIYADGKKRFTEGCPIPG